MDEYLDSSDYYRHRAFHENVHKKRKAKDHILRLHDIVQNSLANKHSVLAVFIDIEKAYMMSYAKK